jgi:mannose-6-phosphate isomerase-like protein (cupin superfamily)
VAVTDGKGFMVERGAGRRTRVEQAATQYKALSADTGGAYTLGEHVLTDDFPLHVHHREDEGLYVLEGRVAATVGADRFSLGPGDFVFMPKGVPHSLESESGTPPRLIFVSTPGGFEHFMDDITELAAEGHGPSSPEWRELEARHEWTLLR